MLTQPVLPVLDTQGIAKGIQQWVPELCAHGPSTPKIKRIINMTIILITPQITIYYLL